MVLLYSDNLKTIITNFSQAKTLSSYSAQLRLKDWLHLSLAYDFDPEQVEQLKQLATAIIDLKANVNWELRVYQKNPDWSWKCLQSWKLS